MSLDTVRYRLKLHLPSNYKVRNFNAYKESVDSGVDGRIILIWIFRKWDVGAWTGSIWLRIGAGIFECGNEPSGSIKCGEGIK
jgi:hypothetical protein